MINISIFYIVFIFLIVLLPLLLISCFMKDNNQDYRIIVSQISKITTNFEYNYNQSIKCLKEKCVYECLLKNKQKNDWKPYTDKDIPGPYPYEYPYLGNTKNICNKNTVLFISVITPCIELEERMAIRKVYENINPAIQIHFFIGYTSTKCQKQYEDERKLFKDMSQMPIQESFSNETIFTLYLHKILPTICPSAKYYGKMDADQYINYSKLLDLLKINKENNKTIYACQVWKNFVVNTDPNYKYSSHKSIAEYYKKELPKGGLISFTGSFALWPSYLSNILYKESLNETHIMRMDDQHISWLVYRINKNKNINICYYDLHCQESYSIYDKNTYTDFGFHRLKGNALYSFHRFISSNKLDISNQKIIPNNIPNREDIGLILENEKFESGIEVGVQNGIYADSLLSRWNSCRIYVMVDPWLQQNFFDDFSNVNNTVQNEIYINAMKVVNKYSSKVEFTILRTTSDKAIPYLKGKLYDFIYLDARHDYMSVKNDLNWYYPLVKPGGIIAGHDYCDSLKELGNEWLLDSNGKKHSDYKATKSAVDEFAFHNKLIITTTDEYSKSWMIRKPN